jgi:uncharacterized membrane protein YhaH (DUF805 family)
MGFQDAIRSVFGKYVTISGRAPRSEYWWWFLFILLSNLALSLVDSAIFGAEEGDAAVFGPIFALATFLPSICVAGRRLHDRDMSAWWLLLALIPLIGFLVLLFFYVQKGTDGPNRFGPDPLAGGGPGSGGETYAPSPIPRSGR